MKQWITIFCAAAITLLACNSARAQQRGYSLNVLEISERGSEWFASDSLDLRGHVRPAIGVVADWAYRPLTARNSGNDRVLSIVRNQFVLHAGASLVLLDRLRLAVNIPIQPLVDGRAATVGGVSVEPPGDGGSIGDIRLGADVRLFGVHGDPITGAVGLQVSLPSGDRDTYSGDGQARISPRFLLAGELDAFVYAARVSVNIRPEEQRFADIYVDTNVSYSISAGIRAVQRRLVIGPELFGHTSLTHDQFFKRRTTPTELMLGLHYLVVDGLRLGAGFGFGLIPAYGSPQHRGLLSVEWTPAVHAALPPPPDRDADGIDDCRDACGFQPGPASSDPVQNGCPAPPADRDHDSVLDPVDACPDDPGIASADPAKNGCAAPPPPPDRDHDSILDANDMCPDEPGVASSDPAKHGCPAPKDSDGDGVLDISDACPNDAGPASSDSTRNGCPKAFIRDNQIKILDQVKFKTSSAEILPGQESEDVLLAVLAVLTHHPEIKAVQIEGHTDSSGGVNHNRELSKQRAQSVRKWLVEHGIDPLRLTAAGFGPDRPIDSNSTDEGRRNNRRVEFAIGAQSSSIPAAP